MKSVSCGTILEITTLVTFCEGLVPMLELSLAGTTESGMLCCRNSAIVPSVQMVISSINVVNTVSPIPPVMYIALCKCNHVIVWLSTTSVALSVQGDFYAYCHVHVQNVSNVSIGNN